MPDEQGSKMPVVLERCVKNWKTTLGGISLTGILGVVAATYVPGMTWKHWLVVALPALIGAVLKDPGSKS